MGLVVAVGSELGVVYPSDEELAASSGGKRVLAALDGDVALSVHTAVGPEADALVKRSGELNLIVFGSRGYGPCRRTPFVSISSPVIQEAHCPVTVLADSPTQTRT